MSEFVTWLNELRVVIRKVQPEVGGKFNLHDLYEFIEEFAAAHPDNRHIRETIRDQLQLLKEYDEVEFVDDEGTYRRIA